MPTRILLISDTHGLIRPEIAEMMPGFDIVIHAGDIGHPETYERLKALNPELLAVAGNVDRVLRALGLPERIDWRHGGYAFTIVHDIEFSGDLSGVDFLVFGHSHKPEEYVAGGTHFINPGSAGPRRFRLPVSYATLEMDEGARYAVRLHEITRQDAT